MQVQRIIPGVLPVGSKTQPIQPSSQNASSFQNVLLDKIDSSPLVFSKHASKRLNSREIELSGEQMKRVESGVSQARAKGINDSLVLVDNVALVVNVRNRVVITAIDKETEAEVFTNIDGAVIV